MALGSIPLRMIHYKSILPMCLDGLSENFSKAPAR